MGILLAFMFLWNMLGALIIVPSLVTFLLPDRKTEVRAGDEPRATVLKQEHGSTALLAKAC